MMTGLPVMLPAYPEIFLLAAGCAILVIDLFLKDATPWMTYALSLAALLRFSFLTVIASGLLLYVMSMIYAATGTLQITEVARGTARILQSDHPSTAVLAFGLVFVVSGLAFKVGVVPFHMWIPDVYHGAPSAVTLFISTGPKLAAFAMALRLVVNAMQPLSGDTPQFPSGWQDMLIVLSVLSMAIGNLAAIAPSNIKRLLAYSTISHLALITLTLLSGIVSGNALSAGA